MRNSASNSYDGDEGTVEEPVGDGMDADIKAGRAFQNTRAADVALFQARSFADGAEMESAAVKVQAIQRGRHARRAPNISELSSDILAKIVAEAAAEFKQGMKLGNVPFELADSSEINVQQQLSRLRNAHRRRNTSTNASSARFRWGAATVLLRSGSNPHNPNQRAQNLLPTVVLPRGAVSPQLRYVHPRG